MVFVSPLPTPTFNPMSKTKYAILYEFFENNGNGYYIAEAEDVNGAIELFAEVFEKFDVNITNIYRMSEVSNKKLMEALNKEE